MKEKELSVLEGLLLDSVRNNNIEAACGMIFEFPVDVNKALDIEGNTALHIASEKGYPSMVKFLVNQGANPLAKNNAQQTPLDKARTLQKKITGGHMNNIDKLMKIAGILNAANDSYTEEKLLFKEALDITPRENGYDEVLLGKGAECGANDGDLE